MAVVSGQTEVVAVMISVMTVMLLLWAGQFVIVGAQEVMVDVLVVV